MVNVQPINNFIMTFYRNNINRQQHYDGDEEEEECFELPNIVSRVRHSTVANRIIANVSSTRQLN